MLRDYNLMAVLPARDMGRARDFYQNVLNLAAPEAMDEENVLYRTGDGTAFLLYKTDNAGSAKNTQMGWETSNIEADMEDLRGRGVVFEDYDFPGVQTTNGLIETPVGKAAWFQDTEGNILNLFQRL